MKDDRAHVLGQIRIALQTAHLPAARATIPPRVKTEQGSRAAMVENFRGELEPLGGMSYFARNDVDALEIVLDLLRQANSREVLMWDEAEIPARGLGEALRLNGYTREKIEMPNDPDARRAKLMELERAGAGITGAQAALADTGTLALVSSPARPRLASLLPPLHIALVKTSQIFSNMAEFFAAQPDVTRNASNIVFVTGPSRTADIELTLQRGVHGPKFLHVVLLENE